MLLKQNSGIVFTESVKHGKGARAFPVSCGESLGLVTGDEIMGVGQK